MAARIGIDLTGKVAVITGASSGIGAASAKLFAEAGARVVVGYNRGVERANAVVGGLAGRGHKAMHLPLEDTAKRPSRSDEHCGGRRASHECCAE